MTGEDEGWLRAQIEKVRFLIEHVTDEETVEALEQLLRELEGRLAEVTGREP